MRTLFVTIIAVVLYIEASASSARPTDYMNMSKTELVKRLGLPTEILLFAGPDPETWRYYYTHDDRVVLMFVVGFRESRVVSCSYDPMFDPGILSPDRPADLTKIWSCIRDNHKKAGRAKSP
jgi:hypothetical protein